MYRVRYYAEQIHPDYFRGGGALGWAIRALNYARWKLETVVQLLVLKFLAKRGGLPVEKTRGILQTFRLDVRAEQIEKEQTSPLREQMEVVIPRSQKYEEGRSIKTALEDASVEEQGLPARPMPLDNLASMYGGDARAARYGKGKRHTLAATEDNFEPVNKAG